MTANVGSVNITVTANTTPLNQSLNQSGQQVNQFANQVGSAMQNTGQEVEGFSSLASSLIEGFAVGFAASMTEFVIGKLSEFGSALMETATRGMEFADEVNSSLRQVQAQTGASAEEMVGLKDSMLGVYSSGLAESLEEAATVMSLVKSTTGATGEQLTETTNDALAFAHAFDADIKETISATEKTVKGFGVSGEQAMDLIAYAMQRTGDPAGDLLGTFNEYSSLMAQIGLNAEQFTAGLIGGLEAGAFNSDVLADSLKEFGISLLDDIEEVGPRMAEVLAAAGDTGAQAWLGVQDEVAKASDEVDKHKAALDEAKAEWDKTNAAVQQYQSELDKAWSKLVQALNPNLDITQYTDKLRQLEQEEIQIKLSLDDGGLDSAKQTMEASMESLDAQAKSASSRVKELQKQLKTADEGQKENIQAQIEGLNDEISAINERKEAVRGSYEAEVEAFENSPAQQRLKQIAKEREEQNLLMKQLQLRGEQEAINAVNAQGFTEAEIKGMRGVNEVAGDVAKVIDEVKQAQQGLAEVTPANDLAKANLDQAQAEYDQTVAIFEELQAKAEGMVNPGEALGLAFQKGGADAQAAMQKFAASLLEARKTMSDADFKALLRDSGFGTLAEELGAEAYVGLLEGITNPKGIAEAATGTVDNIGDKMKDRWGAIWNKLDVLVEPFGKQMNNAFGRILPILEKLVDYASKNLPGALEKIGKAVDSASSKLMPLLETAGMALLENLTPALEWLAGWIESELPKWAQWIYDNSGALTAIIGAVTALGAVLGTGGALGSAIALLLPMLTTMWAALAPVFAAITGGSLTAAVAGLGATAMGVLGTLSAPLLLVVAAVAAFALAWTTNFAGVRDITTDIMTFLADLIASRIAFMMEWWQKYGADIMVVVNGILTVIQTVFGTIFTILAASAEGYRLLWQTFGDEIMAFVGFVFNSLFIIVNAQLNMIGEVIGVFAALIKGDWSGVWEHLINIVQIQGGVMTDLINNFLGLFGTSIDEIVAYFQALPGRIAEYFSPEALMQIASDAMTAFTQTISSMMPSLPGAEFGLPSVGGMVQSATNVASDMANRVTGTLPGGVNNINQSFSFPQPNADINTIRQVVRRETIDIVRQANR